MSPIVSIIMPVYNTGKYLTGMLDSIINQTFTEFELIAVNDGSTDNSLSILKNYEKKDNRIIVVDKMNSGVSDTRNIGLEMAIGEYVCFVDADDILSPDYLKILYEIAQTKNADMVICNYQTFHTELIFSTIEIEIKQNTESKELIDLGLLTMTWTKIIRLSLLKNNNIKFPKGVTFGEDLFFCWKAYMVCNNIWICNQKLYGYRLSGNSAIYKYHDKVYVNYVIQFDQLKKYAIQNGRIDEIIEIDYFFTKRMPTFLKMIVRSKSSLSQKLDEIEKILNNSTISDVLNEQWVEFKRTLSDDEFSLYKNAKYKKTKMCLLYGYKQEFRMKLSTLRGKLSI